MAITIGINGFGRIGRQVYKAIRDHYDDKIDVVAVNDIDNEWSYSVRVADLVHYVAGKGLGR